MTAQRNHKGKRQWQSAVHGSSERAHLQHPAQPRSLLHPHFRSYWQLSEAWGVGRLQTFPSLAWTTYPAPSALKCKWRRHFQAPSTVMASNGWPGTSIS